MNEGSSRNISADVRRFSLKNRVLYVGFSALVAVMLAAGIYLWQHGQVKNIKAQQADLTASFNNLAKKESGLTSENANLSKSLRQLQSQLAASSSSAQGATSTPVNTTPQAAGKFVVTAVKDESGTDFSVSGQPPINSGSTVRAVYVTFSNLTNSVQLYDWTQFYATTDSGVVVDPSAYPGPAGQNVWNNSRLTAGGSQNIVLLFGTGQSLVSLSWVPPGGNGTTISVPLPSTITN